MRRHWLVTLQNLAITGRQWDTDAPMTLLKDQNIGSVQPLTDLASDVRCQLKLERTGDIFRLTGLWRGLIRRHCSRCNAPFDWRAEGDTEREFRLAGGQEARLDENCDNSCEVVAAPGEIDLIDILREDIWLAWKSDVICSDSCRGLCQGCGVDLNRESCQCEQDESDHPFAALRSLQLK